MDPRQHTTCTKKLEMQSALMCKALPLLNEIFRLQKHCDKAYPSQLLSKRHTRRYERHKVGGRAEEVRIDGQVGCICLWSEILHCCLLPVNAVSIAVAGLFSLRKLPCRAYQALLLMAKLHLLIGRCTKSAGPLFMDRTSTSGQHWASFEHGYNQLVQSLTG